MRQGTVEWVRRGGEGGREEDQKRGRGLQEGGERGKAVTYHFAENVF